MNDVHVTGYLLRVMRQVALSLRPGPRTAAVQHQVDEVRRVLDRGQFSPADTSTLRELCEEVEEALQTHLREPMPEATVEA